MQRGPYTKRNVRADARAARLKGLGYDSYSAYLGSPAWRDVKRRYQDACPMACMCGATTVELHHTTYERVGNERLDDLVALCRHCHADAHALEQAGVIDLDLHGFYYDTARAKANAPAVRMRTKRAREDILSAEDRRTFAARMAKAVRKHAAATGERASQDWRTIIFKSRNVGMHATLTERAELIRLIDDLRCGRQTETEAITHLCAMQRDQDARRQHADAA